VKIAPEYSSSTVHVLDASRAVGAVAGLLDPRQREELDRENRGAQAKLRELYGSKQQRTLVPYPEALANRVPIEWRAEDLAKPSFLGRRVLEDFPIAELVPFVDWTFFFSAWELKGKYPKILEHPEIGPAARELFEHGQSLLRRVIDERLIRANGVYGFWPAASEGDDIVLFTDERRSGELVRFHCLRQQRKPEPGKPSRSLADFVAPRSSGLHDHLGAFAVTAGLGEDEIAERFKREHDDYNAIMVKVLADRLAEAFAECLHQRVRREWGYGLDEHLTREDLIAERYRGIRPAFGYPACPDHTEKSTLWELLRANEIGIELTESFAMHPGASVSGIYLQHPQARYFTVGQIGLDQIDDYARRKGMTRAEAERWLSPNLGYEPKG
jgi:5-methyltetrahydrofolate--homocysteine methyltransferase